MRATLILKRSNENPSLEIPLQMEGIKDNDGQMINLRCKSCAKYVNEINSLSTLKRMWIDGYHKFNVM